VFCNKLFTINKQRATSNKPPIVGDWWLVDGGWLLVGKGYDKEL